MSVNGLAALDAKRGLAQASVSTEELTKGSGST